MKKVFVLIPFFFVLFVGSAFAASYAPTQAQIDAFKASHPSSSGFTYGTYTVYLNDGDIKTCYYALPAGVTVSFKKEGSNLYQMHSKFSSGSSFVLFWSGNTGAFNFASNSGQWHLLYEDATKIVENDNGTPAPTPTPIPTPVPTEPGGEWNLEGVMLEEIPGQMAGVGGIVLPTVLKAFAALLIVGLVVRFRRLFLR